MPVSERVSDTLIQVLHKTCAPKKHIGKLQEAAVNRGEKYEFWKTME